MKRPNFFLCTLLLVMTWTPPVLAADTCDLARDVAAKGAATFQKSQADGLRLFVKAHQLCPTDGVLTYNLGMAYYQYGRLAEAEEYLKKAVELDRNQPKWRNNLAALLLERGGQPAQALKYAEAAARSAGNSPEVADTLARARLANGRYWEALSGINKMKGKAKADSRVTRSYAEVIDAYLSHYLEAIRSGRTEYGLAGLKKVDFDPHAMRAYCLALAGLGRYDQALAAAGEAKNRFRGNREISEVFDSVMNRTVRGLYLDFQSGRMAEAVQSAKGLHEKYPGIAAAKKAYDELFNAFVADAKSIEVPEQVAVRPRTSPGVGRAEQLLAGMAGGISQADQSLDLTVDVDQNIPAGVAKKPYAVAVVIGNQRYAREQRGIVDVTYAERDAAVMKKYLETTLGFDPANIIYKTNVTSGDLRTIFGSRANPEGMLHNHVRPGESEVFVYYVGHGAPGPKGKTAYLVPVDAQADYIANNGYDLDLFYRALARLPATKITVVLDSCFSGDSAGGALFTKISPAMLRDVRPVREVANSVIFAGADKGQVATWYTQKRHSLFTYFFLKGLGGAADSNRDKAITTAEMKKYLGKEVPYWANREANRKQTPLVTGDVKTVLVKLR